MLCYLFKNLIRQRYENIFICNPNTVFLNFLSVGNKSTLVGSKSTLVGSKSTLVGKSPQDVGKSPQSVGKPPTPLIVYISIVGTIFFSWVSGQAIHCKLPPRARQGIGCRRPRRCRNNLSPRRTALASPLCVAVCVPLPSALCRGGRRR